MFNDLPERKKKKYEYKDEEAQKLYEKKMMEFSKLVFDLPKKPMDGYKLYLCERLPILKKENLEEFNEILIKRIAKEWQEKRFLDKSEYEERGKKDKIRFKVQLKEFEEKGYYTKWDEEKEKEYNEPKKRKKHKKKRTEPIKNSVRCKRKRSKSKVIQKSFNDKK